MAKRRASASPEGAQPPRRSSRIANGTDASHSPSRHAEEDASARDLKRGDACMEAQPDAAASQPGSEKGTAGSPELSGRGVAQAQDIPSASPRPSLKRKRSPGTALQSPPASLTPTQQLPDQEEQQQQETEENTGPDAENPVHNWVLNDTWPARLFEPDETAKIELSNRDSTPSAMSAATPIPVVQFRRVNGFNLPMPVPRAPTLKRKQSEASLNGSTSQKSESNKTAQYQNANYEILLRTKGSFLRDVENPPETMTQPAHDLLVAEQEVPANSLFDDETFKDLCTLVQDRNEALIVSYLTPYLVPRAGELAITTARHLNILAEGANDTWTYCIPFEGPRPQPDYCVGFKPKAFSAEQLHKLAPLVGTPFENSYFEASDQMYFPFFTCEVKRGSAALVVADRQNAHSMTVAVRGVVELYRAVNREKELDRVILRFSISHDNKYVNIYGHYPVITGTQTTYHRHEINSVGFVGNNGREKWTSHKFVKNVYDIWMPTHLARICSAIENLPEVDFSVSDNSTGIFPTPA